MNFKRFETRTGGTMNKQSPRWLAAAAAALFAAGCAQSNGDISRVQPNVTKKTDLLDGVWYFRNTVTRTPPTTGFAFEGMTGGLEKVVFEIQKDNLIAYRAYPYILGAEINIDETSKVTGTTTKVCDIDGKCVGGQPYYGAPILSFAIKSHFDIQRGYNPATGELSNVISENSSDRVWNEREFMRVDWAANQLSGAAAINLGLDSSSGTWVQPNDKAHEAYDWPQQEKDQNGKLRYFDYTARYIANPSVTYIEDIGYFPLCYLGYYGIRGYEQYDCASAEVKMRFSFSRVDPQVSRDYEPLVYGNDLMTKFGLFRTERLNYDRKWGYNEKAVVLLGNRHRIWQSSFQKDSAGEPDVTRPLAFDKRAPKPIVYYFTSAERMGPENQKEFIEPGRRLEKNWDVAFRRAVAAAQGKDPGQVEQMVYVCETPVPAGAPAACGKTGFNPRFGDLRYNFLQTIAEPVPNGLLGYGPSSADPETGEIISANANTYLGSVFRIGQSIQDTVDLLLGETTEKQLITGQVVRDYMANNPAYPWGTIPKAGQIPAELQSVPTRNEESLGAFEKPTQRSVELTQQLRANGGLPKYSRDAVKAAADTLALHPQLESAILDNPDVAIDLRGLLPPELRKQAAADPEFKRKASRHALANATGLADFQKRRIEWVSRNNLYLEEFYDRTLLSVAYSEAQKRTGRMSELKAQGKSDNEARAIANEELKRRMRQATWQATSEHEIGHTFGLRHNFQASYDAINYYDEYWAIRSQSLTVQQGGQSKLPRTPADLTRTAQGTQAQLANGMYDFEYSSIMDYSGKRNGDWKGIGKYDEAAIIFAYSGGTEPGYVEVFNGARRNPATFPGSDGANVTVTGAAFDLPIVNAERVHPTVRSYTERYHYTMVPLHFGEGAGLDQTIADGLGKLKNRSLKKWSEVKAEQDRLRKIIDTGVTPTDADVGNSPLEVPYQFCTDDHVGYVLACARFDRGPDYYEINRQYLEDYWNFYFFTHFKRDRWAFTTSGAFNTAINTFFPVSDMYKHWAFEFFGKPSAAQQDLRRYAFDATFQDYWTMAVLDGVNQHLNVLATPPAGLFAYRTYSTGPQWDLVNTGDDYDALSSEGRRVLEEYYSNQNTWGSQAATGFADLPRGFGRQMYSRYDFKSGFGFFDRLLEAGHYNDQIGALFAAVIPDLALMGVDWTADQNRYNVPYYLVFKPELNNLFGALWAYDEPLVRPTMFLKLDDAGLVTKNPAIYQRKFIDGATLVQNFNFPLPLTTPTPQQKSAPANIQITWTSRIYSLYLGEALFRVNYDLDFAKRNQVFKLGSKESHTVAAGSQAVEVQDIVTGSRYVAIEPTGTGPEVYPTPAVRMVKQAKQLLQVVNTPTMCPLPTLAAYTSCMSAAEANNPALVEARRKLYTQYFQDQLRDLDLMRGMYQAYGMAF